MKYETIRRPGSPEDREFLFVLLRRALGPQIEETYGPWDEEWQRRHFLDTTDPTEHEILESDGTPMGCLLFSETPDELWLNRIFLLPEYQNQRIGTRIMEQLISAASARGQVLRLQVIRTSPAFRFYERLGFRTVGETETHLLLERMA